jgi:two-component system, NarL family, sensor histidine kinase DesK
LQAFKGSLRWRTACLVTEVMIMIATMIILSPGYIWMIFYPSSVLGAGFNLRQIRFSLIAMCTSLLTVAVILSVRMHLVLPDWLMIFAGVVAGVVATYATWWQTQTMHSREKLKKANLQIERLTKIAERERISQDLHDVMGHELSMITLKSQLVERLIDRDPNRAKAEVADIERAARSALTRVREYIADIRQPNLREEWEDAEKLLTMAGISTQTEYTVQEVATASHVCQVFAMCVREAVTNLVKHSAAKTAYLQVWQTRNVIHLVIADDGGGLPTEEKARGQEQRMGSGIIGMRARLASIDGRLHIWSNGEPVNHREGHLPVVLPWESGTCLHFRAPMASPVSKPLEEVQHL